jgi:deoxyadenosine/deoxycytidine kinase
MIVTVDGNIGCGKSSVLQYIHSRYALSIDLEPVAKWQPYLTEMYETGKNAFEFQVRVWLDRCWIQQLPNQSSIIMERSPYFQSAVFVPANIYNGNITEREYYTLQELYAHTLRMWHPSIYIYLRSNPNECYRRIHHRNRTSESHISLDYLQNLHNLHENAYVYAYMNYMSVICVDVEGKTIQQIGDEIFQILKMGGM